MSDSGDEKVSRRYRELAREEPPAHADAAILAAARGRTPVSREASRAGSGVRPRFSTWMGPLSIAAVLVLGIGVSLRMQLEKPGIETSEPAPSEYSVPQSAEPGPQAPAREEQAAPKQLPERKEPARAAEPVEKTQPLAKRIEPPAKPQAAPERHDAREPAAFPDAPAIATAPAAEAPAPRLAAPVPAAPPAPAQSPLGAARAPAAAQSTTVSPPAAAESTAAPPPAATGAVAPQSAPLRAKREAFATDSAAARESRPIPAVADPDPDRELERIARLREAGRHADADRALDEFRRRHPGFRIPEPVWERVKPR